MLNFGLVFHNHQPVGNDDKAIESVYKLSYLPFLKTLAAYPGVKANLHFSGYLLEWFEKNHPEFISKIVDLVDRDQVEIVGGGYYEPILSVIPDVDARAQVDLLSEKILSLFGARPHGLWTAERAWEPQEPEILAQCGIKYTILDDTIFRLTGIDESSCFKPYFVESRGHAVTIFPLLKVLRHFIPFDPVERTISYLKTRDINSSDSNQIAVFADDGEKFGAWPTTHEQVYKRGWLKSFFATLLKKESLLKTVTLTEYLSKSPARNCITLPSASYEELMQWALLDEPSTKIRADGEKLGFWRLFLSKYPESGRLYSKMLMLSMKANRISGSEEKHKALAEIWKAQYNDVYWHGIFGGLYFPKFRLNAYHYLIQAETILDPLLHYGEKEWVSLESFENGCLSLSTKSLNLVVNPGLSGSIVELDYKPKGLNLFDTLTRRYEKYHDEVRKVRIKPRSNSKKATSIHGPVYSKEKGLSELLVYDRYLKSSFMDYLLENDTTIENFSKQNFVELADLAGFIYTGRASTKNSISLTRRCRTRDKKWDVDLLKTFTARRNAEIVADYVIQNKLVAEFDEGGPASTAAKFAVEINLASLGDTKFEKSFSKQINNRDIEEIEFEYPERQIRIIILKEIGDFPLSAWILPQRTVSQSESGVESNFQGISVILNQAIELKEERTEKKCDFRLSLRIEKS